MELKFKVEDDAVLEDGDEQHDGEACEQPHVLQQEVTQVTAFVLLTVAMKHLR